MNQVLPSLLHTSRSARFDAGIGRAVAGLTRVCSKEGPAPKDQAKTSVTAKQPLAGGDE
jgi:hypothetical protein